MLLKAFTPILLIFMGNPKYFMATCPLSRSASSRYWVPFQYPPQKLPLHSCGNLFSTSTSIRNSIIEILGWLMFVRHPHKEGWYCSRIVDASHPLGLNVAPPP
jgi:hypothetical protein